MGRARAARFFRGYKLLLQRDMRVWRVCRVALSVNAPRAFLALKPLRLSDSLRVR